MDERILYQVLDTHLLDDQPDQWGAVLHNANPKSIGFATTLTPAIIKQASKRNLDLIVTHHDAWDFMLEQQTESKALLEQYKISHIWCHEPLDKADFGTAAALIESLGCKIINKIADDCGRIGELTEKRDLSKIIELLDGLIAERPCRCYDATKPISRIGCVPGAGMRIEYLAEAAAYGIDLFITGETSLYLLEYAAFRDISALIYSHNYTEILGTQNLALKIAAYLAIKETVRLDEPHF